MFYSYFILKPTFPTPSTFPSLATELYNPKLITNECAWRFDISSTYIIESIESKLIFACLINDYSLHIFVYEQAELSSISLECTKVKLSIQFCLKDDDIITIFDNMYK